MQYKVISADGHIDLPWLPERLFVDNARAEFKDAMPYVVDGPKGKTWVARNGAQFGLKNGMGSAGREYVPGHIHRAEVRRIDGILYCNDGDWVESCTALLESPGGELTLWHAGGSGVPGCDELVEIAA